MKKNYLYYLFSLLFYIFLAFFLTLVVVVLIPIVAGLDLQNITLTQQNDVCNVLNLTFVDCYELWSIVESYEFNVTCSVCNYSNYTLNSEIKNCTECICNDSETDALIKIDDYKKRGFEPVFEGGIIVNWKKIGNESCEAFDCTEQCFKAVESAKDQFKCPEGEPEPNNAPYFWFLVIMVVGILAFYGLRKFYLNFRKIPSMPNYAEKFSKPPKPPKPVDDLGDSSDGGDKDDF